MKTRLTRVLIAAIALAGLVGASNIRPADALSGGTLQSITVPAVIQGNTTVEGEVALSSAVSTDTLVTLNSAINYVGIGPEEVVPASIVIPAGQTKAPFNIETRGWPGVPIDITITATKLTFPLPIPLVGQALWTDPGDEPCGSIMTSDVVLEQAR